MFRPTRTDVRRGNILLVTMLLLALFAIVGTTLVYYAMAAAERAKIQGQYMSTGDTDFPDDGRPRSTRSSRSGFTPIRIPARGSSSSPFAATT